MVLKWCRNNSSDFWLFVFFSLFFPLLSSPSVSRFLLTQLITKRNNQSATSPSQSLLFYDPHYAHFTSRNAQLTQHIQHPGHAHLCNATKYVGYPPLGLKSLTHRHPHSSSVLIPFPPKRKSCHSSSIALFADPTSSVH